jgi:uncharacterized protein YprB with RNaseH-like and TPR domain
VSRGTSSSPLFPGWTEAGFRVLKRELSCELTLPLICTIPRSLAVIIPDLVRFGRIPLPEELLFFDLETTGLSGGAGTIAFLAAFGRLTSSKGGNTALTITQYLLLDYPGESEFIENLLKELAASPERAGGGLPLVVSYNGKCFDSQILKNRCLLNRIRPPECHQADLLHPSRRLWKDILNDCSQATIEVEILGLDRSGDVSGAMAPEIWFSFLRGGYNSQAELLSVCDHNAKDVAGLAALFLAFVKIADDPFSSRNAFRFDDKALALFWWKAVRKHPSFFVADEFCVKTAFSLLEAAAKNGSPQAAVALAKDAEWRLRDIELALHYTNLALVAAEIPLSFRDEIEKRLIRLEKKRLSHNFSVGLQG